MQFTISPLTAAIAWGTTLFPCDGESHVPVATVTNLIGSDICTVTVDGAQTQPGTYTATVSALSNSNYALPDPAPTAQFTITEMPVVTVTVYPIGYGSVSGNSYNVYYNTTYTTQDNVLTFSDGQVCTATPATPTVEYVYVFDNWSSDSGTIT